MKGFPHGPFPRRLLFRGVAVAVALSLIVGGVAFYVGKLDATARANHLILKELQAESDGRARQLAADELTLSDVKQLLDSLQLGEANLGGAFDNARIFWLEVERESTAICAAVHCDGVAFSPIGSRPPFVPVATSTTTTTTAAPRRVPTTSTTTTYAPGPTLPTLPRILPGAARARSDS